MKNLLIILIVLFSAQTGFGQSISSYQTEIENALNDPNIDRYFKEIYKLEKIIHDDNDDKMLSVTDSLFTKDTKRDYFYFVVFTKSMNGSDGFYSESVGLKAFTFIQNNTEKFADYFNVALNLTENDLNNWGYYIYGEILISRENQELQAIEELEKKLITNISGSRKEYRLIIEKLIAKIKTEHSNH